MLSSRRNHQEMRTVARTALVGTIGLLCVLAQPSYAQVGSDPVGTIALRNSQYRERFQELLLSHETVDLAAGWSLARNLGRPVVPMLWGMFDEERSNVRPRVVLLIAAVLAGGPAADDRLFALLDRHKPMIHERTMAAMLLALGPRRDRPVAGLWARLIGPNTEPEPLLELASRLACARYPEAAKSAQIMYEGDPGIVAAAVFGGFQVSPQRLRSLWRSPVRYSELYYRGALLGASRRLQCDGIRPASSALAHAEELLGRSGSKLAAAQAAAMLLLARAGALDPSSERPDWMMLQLCASQPASEQVLRKWLTAKPLARDEQPARIAVGYALLQPIEKVIREHALWSADKRISGHVAVALAFRLAAGSVAAAPAPDRSRRPVGSQRVGPANVDPIKLRLPEVPEFRFAAWASGGDFGKGPPLRDRQLQRLGDLIIDGRASRTVVRRTLEEALWRWGSHPGLAQWREERLLIRDLLLAGSKPGLKYASHLRPTQRYFATGLDKSDSFYSVAVKLYEFLGEPIAPIPVECRIK